MLKGHLKHRNPWAKCFVWFAIMLLLTALVMTIWTILPIDHQSTASLKWFQFVQTLATFFIPPFFLAYLVSDQPSAWLQLNRIPQWPTWMTAILLMLAALPAINLLADWNSHLTLPQALQPLEEIMRQQEDAAMALTERFLQGKGAGLLLINIVLMALLPAMAEELTFRGTLQRLAAGTAANSGTKLTARQHVAIWGIAILFSAIHFQFYGFVPRMLLGALFGYTLCWTGSLWIPIAMHFTNNAATVIAYWVIYNNNLNPDAVETFGTGDTTWIGLISFAVAGIGVYFLCRLSRTISNASSRMSWGN